MVKRLFLNIEGIFRLSRKGGLQAHSKKYPASFRTQYKGAVNDFLISKRILRTQ